MNYSSEKMKPIKNVLLLIPYITHDYGCFMLTDMAHINKIATDLSRDDVKLHVINPNENHDVGLDTVINVIKQLTIFIQNKDEELLEKEILAEKNSKFNNISFLMG